ncbi:hypothetical protein [Rubinisphaera brasiliensis]|uniref:PBS lyase HEAT domain protein repeat-containing protein n=1 Tax=Rubinisphaera brasiliensis (strain ATCC 49424 / DSM 5305 / JCM 21570 / IAM 15109 / NBRC 103401 / IFAM 1448) TaxID=756272 RepID=F0SKN8_RUBBR|nr:hypothetical protein [Rubinisphaera brasiliensis]ADY58708.1 hypothetical protein Plabr_1090 [Rubinisphaera brasiliensis DSM 5305]
MWTLSEKAYGCVRLADELAQSRRWFRNSNKLLAVLEDLHDIQEPALLPWLSEFLLDKDESVRSVARKLIGAKLAEIPAYKSADTHCDLTSVNESVFWAYRWDAPANWRTLKPSQVATAAGPEDDTAYAQVLGLLSFHRNGYVRQEAVRLLTRIRTGEELRFLLIRQNDWVDPVAREAQAAVRDRISTGYVRHFIACFRLLLHLSEYRRYNLQNVVQDVMSLLLSTEQESLLLGAIADPDRHVRRRVAKFALNEPGDHLQAVVNACLISPDPVVRLWAVPQVPMLDDEDACVAILDQLADDRFMPIRREVSRVRIARHPETAESVWSALLFDPSRSLRELARFSLIRRGMDKSELAVIYRNKLQDEPELLPVIEGFSETAEPADAAYFQNLLDHPLPSRRCAAVRGIVRLLGEDATSDVLPYLDDVSPSVARTVSAQIRPIVSTSEVDVLVNLALNSSYTHCQRNAIDLIVSLGKWESIPHLLHIAATVTSSDISAYAEDKATTWFTSNRNFTRPRPQEIQAVKAVIDQYTTDLPGELVATVRKGLSWYR